MTASPKAQSELHEVLELPATAFRLSEPEQSTVEIIGTDDEPRFRLVAYSGGIIPNHWVWGNLVLDLTGMILSRPDIPVLREHYSGAIVGYADKVTVEGQLIIEGPFNLVTEDSRQVYELCKAGHPWQASIYFPPVTIERVAEGKTAKVNGRTLPGPGTVIRKWRLREASFCSLGSDENTEGRALAEGANLSVPVKVLRKEHEMEEVTISKEEYEGLKAGAIELADLKKIEITAELVHAEHPHVAEALLQEGAEGAMDAERARILGIQEASFPGQEKLVKKLVEEGTALADAQAQILADPKVKEDLKKARVLLAYKDGAPPSPGPDDEGNKGKSELSDEERWTAEFMSDEAVRKEFGDVETYLSFKQAEADKKFRMLTKKD